MGVEQALGGQVQVTPSQVLLRSFEDLAKRYPQSTDDIQVSQVDYMQKVVADPAAAEWQLIAPCSVDNNEIPSWKIAVSKSARVPARRLNHVATFWDTAPNLGLSVRATHYVVPTVGNSYRYTDIFHPDLLFGLNGDLSEAAGFLQGVLEAMHGTFRQATRDKIRARVAAAIEGLRQGQVDTLGIENAVSATPQVKRQLVTKVNAL